MMPETPICMALNNNTVCLGFKKEYSLLDLDSQQVKIFIIFILHLSAFSYFLFIF